MTDNKHARYAARHPDRKALSAAKHRAKKDGVPFDLTPEDLPPIPRICPVLGIMMAKGSGAATWASPSLDRIVPHLGYVKGNVHWISRRANLLKNNASPSELMKVATYFLELEKESYGSPS